MSSKKRALGRGLGALLPPKPEASAPAGVPVQPVVAEAPEVFEGENLRRIPIAQIKPNPSQPRQHFDEESLEELAASIRAHGIIQPVAVARRGDAFLLIAGERRWRAAQRAGLTELPVIELELSEQQLLEYALVENLQRENLNPLEEARAYRSLIATFGLSQEQVADRVGKSRPAVANTLRLLNLPANLQGDIEAGLISAGHARALLTCSTDQQRERLRDAIVNQGISVRAAEAMAQRFQAGPGPKAGGAKAKAGPRKPDDIRRLEEALVEHFACRVVVKPLDDKRGRIEIHYDSLDELDGILAKSGVDIS